MSVAEIKPTVQQTAAAPQSKRYSEAQMRKLQKAAEDFESLFVQQLLKQMRKSIPDSGLFGEGMAGDIYQSMFDESISKAIAGKGSFQLADTILRSFNADKESATQRTEQTLPDYRTRTVQKTTPRPPAQSGEKWDRSIIQEAASKYGVDPKLVESVIKVESDFRPKAVSKSGAIGLMQLMKATAEDLGVRNRFDPRENVFGGTRYLSGLLRRFDGNLKLALAGYNAGPGAVEKHAGIPPYKETQNYVEKVLKHYKAL